MTIDPNETDATMATAERPPMVFVRGSGSWLEDRAGKRYLDFVQGWAVNSLGHCPPSLADALARQARTLLSPSPAFHHEAALRLAQRLCAATGMERAFLCSSGAEANEGAVKLARKWGQLHRGGASEIVTCDGAFHGRTLAMMAASGKPGWDRLFPPRIEGFVKARFGDLDSVRAALGPRTVAVMLEPVQGEAGVVPAPEGFLPGLRALCDAHGLLLIVDEVQTGMGRCGAILAVQRVGVRADIVTLGKGIGGGVPLAALLATRAAACFAPGDQGGTYCGNALAAAAGLAVLEVIDQPEFLAAVRGKGERLQHGLARLAARHALPGERGLGLLRALDLGRPLGAAVVAAARALEPDGLLLNSPRPSLLRFMPALNVGDHEIDTMLDQLDGVLTQVLASDRGPEPWPAPSAPDRHNAPGAGLLPVPALATEQA